MRVGTTTTRGAEHDANHVRELPAGGPGGEAFPVGSGGVATGTTNGPSATLTHTANNPAVTSGAGSAHSHTISWPAGVPTIAGYTPAGSISAPTFTGSPTSIVQPYIVVYFWKRIA